MTISHPSEGQVLRCFGKNANKVEGVDFDGYGFTIHLKHPYVFAANETGAAGFDYGDNWEGGILAAVRNAASTITPEDQLFG